MQATEDGRRARGAARRSLVLDAAIRVVAENGSGALTHRAVAAEAQVSIASVSYHFPSAEELRRATLEYAGSSIGLELAGLVLDASASVEDTPEICAAFATHLLNDRRVETAAVFELIVAAGHDENLRPIVAAFNDHLADLLTPYEGDRSLALAAGAAVQGLLLVYLASSPAAGPSGLGASVADLIRRYRAHEPATPGRDLPGSHHN
jgi:DNA-binding transcriptional regulator YbjK